MGWTSLVSSLLVVSMLSCSYAQDSSPTTQGSSPLEAESPTHLQHQAEALQTLQQADIIYLGEQHDSAADHAAQLAILMALYDSNPQLAIGLEMIQRPFQPVLDRYLAGEITETELVDQSEYEDRWGFPWEYYAPILRFAKEHQLPVIALNAPTEVTRKVARQGLAGLTPEDFRYIPDRANIDTSNTAYQNLVKAAFGDHAPHGNFNFDYFFAAQVVWDETMAMSIAAFRQAHPETQVVVLAGQGHVVYGYGIPDRVQRRLGDDLSQQIVLLNPDESLGAAPAVPPDGTPKIADLFWYHP